MNREIEQIILIFLCKARIEFLALRSILHLLVFCLILASCTKQSQISYVNPNKLMQGYHGATAQHEVFQAKAKIWQQRIDSLGTERQALDSEPVATREAK